MTPTRGVSRSGARVLYVVPLFAPYRGGIETLSTQMLPALGERGHEFCVVARHAELELPDVETVDGVEIHRFDTRTALEGGPTTILALEERLRAIKREFRPDVVHINDMDSGWLWFHVRTRNAWAAPEIVTLHGVFTEYPLTGETVLRRLIDGAAWITGVSSAALDVVQAACPEVRLRSSLIPNGLQVVGVEPRPYPADPIFVCVGRLDSQKGFDIAIEALALIESVERPRLIIVGQGIRERALRQQAAARGIAEQVELVGSRSHDETLALIASATAVVVPSRELEGFSLAALEAALLARPVIASDVGGLAETVVDGETGIVVAPDDPKELAAALTRLLTDPDLVAMLGRAARSRAMREYPLDACVRSYDALYRRLATAAP